MPAYHPPKAARNADQLAMDFSSPQRTPSSYRGPVPMPSELAPQLMMDLVPQNMGEGVPPTTRGLCQRFNLALKPEALKDELYIHQAQVYVKVLEHDRHILITGKTGTGKTHLAFAAASQVLAKTENGFYLNPNQSATPELLERAKAMLSTSPESVESVNGVRSPKKRAAIYSEPRVSLICATPKALENDIDSGVLSLEKFKPKFAIIDECHNCVKDAALATLTEKLVKAGVKCIFLSATPVSDDLELANFLRRFQVEEYARGVDNVVALADAADFYGCWIGHIIRAERGLVCARLALSMFSWR